MHCNDCSEPLRQCRCGVFGGRDPLAAAHPQAPQEQLTGEQVAGGPYDAAPPPPQADTLHFLSSELLAIPASCRDAARAYAEQYAARALAAAPQAGTQKRPRAVAVRFGADGYITDGMTPEELRKRDERQQAEIAELRAALAAAPQAQRTELTDALRYRWLRDEVQGPHTPLAQVVWKLNNVRDSGEWTNLCDGASLDQHIDAARKGQE